MPSRAAQAVRLAIGGARKFRVFITHHEQRYRYAVVSNFFWRRRNHVASTPTVPSCARGRIERPHSMSKFTLQLK
jgi:hypothetical protein